MGSISLYSDEWLLKTIEKQYLYCDYNSTERETGLTKKKYKVATAILDTIGIYTFIPITKNQSSCPAKLTLSVKYSEWESLDGGHLRNDVTSYINLKKIEVLTQQEVLLKKRDSSNKFPLIARLPDQHYQKLRRLKQNSHSLPVDPEVTEMLNLALDDITTDQVNSILKNLKL